MKNQPNQRRGLRKKNALKKSGYYFLKGFKFDIYILQRN